MRDRRSDGDPEKAQALNRLRLRYQDAIDISERKLNDALESGLKELSRRAMTLEINTARSPLVKKVRQWSGLPVEQPAAEHREQREGMNGVHGIESVLNAEAQEDASARPDPETVMGAGIRDVTNSLVEDFNLNDVLLMVLETIYRGWDSSAPSSVSATTRAMPWWRAWDSARMSMR